MLRQREDKNSPPTGALAFYREGERRGKHNVGVCVGNVGANDFVVRDVLVRDVKVVRPFLCIRKPTTLSDLAPHHGAAARRRRLWPLWLPVSIFSGLAGQTILTRRQNIKFKTIELRRRLHHASAA
jgi:hypothetical protein